MRQFKITITLWHDPHWRGNLRRSWKSRRFWLAKPDTNAARGRATSFQFGAYTLKVMYEGATHG